ncbi:MAG: 2Fe-2S iron-sulfur cluster-binding protein [Dehalococcoidales bacterium]|nr:2Fe-2S iron-sulfur cluster-binding protein [Dehalococcoidales bacterium]
MNASKEKKMSNITLTIDGKEIQARSGMTVLEAALENGISIPHLCYHPELKPPGACRLCMVEMADGELVTACRVTVKTGMNIQTRSEAVDKAVRPIIELLVAYHHDNCRGCPANGKCELQKIMALYKIDRKRVRQLQPPAETKPVAALTSYFQYDANRCIQCGICLSTCEQVCGESLLHYVGRGHEMSVAFYGDEKKCEHCLKCLARCPVGALFIQTT